MPLRSRMFVSERLNFSSPSIQRLVERAQLRRMKSSISSILRLGAATLFDALLRFAGHNEYTCHSSLFHVIYFGILVSYFFFLGLRTPLSSLQSFLLNTLSIPIFCLSNNRSCLCVHMALFNTVAQEHRPCHLHEAR